MVRHGQISETLTDLLQSFGVEKGNAKECDFCDHFSCWRALDLCDGYLAQFPKQLRDLIYQKWWNINGFRFLELPAELRETILEFAMPSVVEPLETTNQLIRI